MLIDFWMQPFHVRMTTCKVFGDKVWGHVGTLWCVCVGTL